MKYDVYNLQAEKIKKVDLNPAIFGVPAVAGLLHQAVVAQTANARKVLAHTKGRGDVRGGGRKPWRQKGTGRARHGSSRSPIWVGGGVTFGPSKDRNFSQKINKKMRRKALFMALSDRAADKSLALVDKLEFTSAKTKEFANVLGAFKDVLGFKKRVRRAPLAEKGAAKSSTSEKNREKDKVAGADKKFNTKSYKISVLVVSASKTAAVARVARNIAGVKVTSAAGLNVLEVLQHRNLLMTEESLQALEQTFIKARNKH